MTLIAFDVDGTLECKEENSQYISGPVKLNHLLWLSTDFHNVIVMVSPSPYAPKEDIKEIFIRESQYGSNTMRHRNLLKAKEKYPQKDNLYLYVSDNGDYAEAKKAGFIYIDALMFANGYS